MLPVFSAGERSSALRRPAGSGMVSGAPARTPSQENASVKVRSGLMSYGVEELMSMYGHLFPNARPPSTLPDVDYTESPFAPPWARLYREIMSELESRDDWELWLPIESVRRTTKMEDEGDDDGDDRKDMSSERVVVRDRDAFVTLDEKTESWSIRSLKIDDVDLDVPEAQIIRRVVSRHREMAELTIVGGTMRFRARQVLEAALRNSQTPPSVSFWYTGLEESQLSTLARGARSHRSLEELDFMGNALGPTGAALLVAQLASHRTLWCLRLPNTKLGSAGAAHIAKMLDADTRVALRVLDLGECEIGDDGVEAIASVLVANRTLKELNLSHNAMGDRGAAALMGMLRSNNALRVLHVRGNDIGVEVVAQIATALHRRAVVGSNDDEGETTMEDDVTTEEEDDE